MDLVSPIVDVVGRVWDCTAKHRNYLRGLEENLDNLRTEMDRLKDARNDIKIRVDAEEAAQMMIRTHVVDGWLNSVEAMEPQVSDILRDRSRQLERCLSGCCPKNCWTSYKFGKKVIKKLALVKDLKSKGAFDVVTQKALPAVVKALPAENSIVGMDSTFERVWTLLGKDEVGILGLYGMGGVGKTTLLRKINNEFLKTSSVFDFVVWAEISKRAETSKEIDIGHLQSIIRRRLELSWPEDADLSSRAQVIFNFLMKKRFVLLLDDIWQPIDLLKIGIPQPGSQNKCKVIFTTRSKALCGRMDADRKIRLECLNRDQAWTLFQKKVGQEILNSHPEIQELAKDVAKECAGLPLALVTVARSMASKRAPQEWKDAITTLQKSAAELSGMDDEVLSLLKLSYDNLPDDSIRSCFLYCSLYPEDYSIHKEKLIEQWIWEGYIDGFEDFADAFNRGHSIIGFLQATCLLESGVDEDTQVKMHDVIRDMALWIACECGSEKNRVLVKANKASDEPPKADKWIKAQWISMMHTSITQLIVVPDCPRLSTLLLFNNSHLKKIHPNFFQSMPLLKFLDLSSTSISYLPPSIGDLARLEFLDLSDTKIKELPSEIMKLENLKYLSFKMTEKLHQIQPGVIAHLSNLQMLKLRDHNFGDGDEALQASVQELACLKQMNALEILISNVKFLESFLSYPRLVLCTRSLSIESCKGLISLALSSLEYMKRLQKFVIGDCSELKELIIDCSTKTAGVELFRSLEIMVFSALPRLDISWDINIPHAACFKNLHTLFLDQCDMLVNLTWLFLTPNIRVLHVKRCLRIEEIISDEFGAFGASLFSKLATLVLDDLPCLWSICRSPLPFLSLKLIVVLNCPKLRRLPFDSNSAKDKLEKITGRSEWWENLEWDNETIEREFAPYLSEYIPYMFRVYVPQMYLDEENQNACCIS